jgi:hypothetical protein
VSGRFIVREVEGFVMSKTSGSQGGASQPQLSTCVLDTAYCHGIVQYFNSENVSPRNRTSRADKYATVRRRAEELAAKLNREAAQATKGTEG